LALRSATLAALLAAVLPALAGCYAGAAGVVFLVRELSGGSDGASPIPDAAPVVGQVKIEPAGSRDRIRIEFTIENDDPGRLSARVAYQRLNDRLEPQGAAASATPAPEADPVDLENLPTGRRVGFTWDAERDLSGGSSLVQISLTPIEDGIEGRTFSPQPFRAGNTPVQVRGLSLRQRGNLVDVKFDLVDEESDLVSVSTVKLSVNGSDFHDLPLEVLASLERVIRASPGPKGSPADIRFQLTDLDQPDAHPDLLLAGRPGFVGTLSVRVSLRELESPAEGVETEVGPEPFDNNEPPQVEVLPLFPDDLSSGLVPIRYRIFDPEENLVRIQVEVDPGEGVFRPAHEFQSAISEGMKDLTSLGLRTGPDLPFHTFLWDAISQGDVFENAAVRVTATDAESGPPSFPLRLPPFSLTAVERQGEVGAGDDPRSLLTGDFDGDGFDDVVVLNVTPDTVTFFRGGPDLLSPEEGRRSTFPVGSIPSLMVKGDFNGDGLPDFAVASRLTRSGTGTGSIACFHGRKGQDPLPVPEITLGPSLAGLFCADFDGDGRSDLLACKIVASDVAYLWGGADGLLEGNRRELSTLGLQVASLLGGDFDGDGNPDAIAVGTQTAGKLIFFPGAGSPAGLRDSVGREFAAGNSPGEALGADFDRDGKLDLVLASANLNELTYLRWQSGGFTPAEAGKIQITGRARALAAGDFNLDGWPDLAVSIRSSKTLVLLAGSAGGLSSEREQELALERTPTALASGDFDGDGFPDLATANQTNDDVSLLRGGVDGLAREVQFPAGDGPQALAGCDLDGDGQLDLVAANRQGDSLTTIRGGARGLKKIEELSVGGSPGPSALADFDGDRILDLVVAFSALGKLRYFQGGLEGFRDEPERRRDLPGNLAVRSIIAGDFNGDDYPDLVAAVASPGGLRYFPGGADGLPAVEGQVRSIPLGTAPEAFLCGHFDADPYLDLVVADAGSGQVHVLLGGAGGPTPKESLSTIVNPSLLTSGDFDLDGHQDLLVASTDFDGLTYLAGSASGFTARADPGRGTFHVSVIAGDFDGDGFPDVVVANSGGRLQFLRGGPAGLGQTPAAAEVKSTTSALSSSDYDGDGFLDLAAVSLATGLLDCLRGGADGLSDSRKTELKTGSFPSSLAGGDFSGDGYPDLVVANDGSAEVTQLRGGASGLTNAGALLSETGVKTLLSGDCDGDGLLDLVVLSQASGAMTHYRQRYLTPHPGRILDPGAPAPALLSDPRGPARYAIELPPNAFAEPTQVTLVPGPIFELPQAEYARRGKYLIALTEPVTVLLDSTVIPGGARLTLRLGDHDPALPDEARSDPGRIRVIRRGQSGAGETLEGIAVQVLEFRDGHGISFPISAFGSYVAALERTRP
jgi:hypothetical protein